MTDETEETIALREALIDHLCEGSLTDGWALMRSEVVAAVMRVPASIIPFLDTDDSGWVFTAVGHDIGHMRLLFNGNISTPLEVVPANYDTAMQMLDRPAETIQ